MILKFVVASPGDVQAACDMIPVNFNYKIEENKYVLPH